MKPHTIFFIAATVICTLAFFLLSHGQWQKDRKAFETDRAVTIGRAVSWYVSNADDPETLQDFVNKARSSIFGVKQIFVLKNVKYKAHSNPELADERLSQESEGDKALFDKTAIIKAAVKKNSEEREVNPSLKRDAYPEVLIEHIENRTKIISASLPVKKETSEYDAMVQVDLYKLAPFTRLPILYALFAGIFIVLFMALSSIFKHRSLFIPGLIGLTFLIGFEAWSLARWHNTQRQIYAHFKTRILSELGESGLLLATEDSEKITKIGSFIAISSIGEQIGDVVAIRDLKSQVQNQPAMNGTLTLTHHNFAVDFAKSFFENAQQQTVRHLIWWTIGFAILAILGFCLGVLGQLKRFKNALVKHKSAYFYMSPALLGMLVLVFIPVAFGLILGFLKRQYNVFEFAGLENYINILSNTHITDPSNFYFKLGVTILWTFLNVSLHVSIGLFLALLLNDQMLKAKGIYRVILVIPWAVPSYITALIWKGMFHKQFGAVNFFLQSLGIEPVSWFQSFIPAFAANVTTNTWLGFPFMMVISLGALQSIPGDLYEASRVDGANRWQKFKFITLPLLMPALVPAVIVGTVWTFNMFNVIYLVSGGAPDGATDILITDAFRWAFERDNYGYAAAYATLIFIILLLFTLVTNKLTRATKSAYE